MLIKMQRKPKFRVLGDIFSLASVVKYAFGRYESLQVGDIWASSTWPPCFLPTIIFSCLYCMCLEIGIRFPGFFVIPVSSFSHFEDTSTIKERRCSLPPLPPTRLFYRPENATSLSLLTFTGVCPRFFPHLRCAVTAFGFFPIPSSKWCMFLLTLPVSSSNGRAGPVIVG